MLTTTSIKAFLATQRGRDQLRSVIARAEASKGSIVPVRNKNFVPFLNVEIKGNNVHVYNDMFIDVTCKVKKALEGLK